MDKLERSKNLRPLFSFSAFHFIDDGFSDTLYILLPFIASELNLSFSQVGFLKGVFASMSLLQFPLSFLGERVGELALIAVGSFGLAAGFLIMSRAHTFLILFLSLIFGKAMAAGQHGLSSSILSRIFEVSGRRAAMGAYNFSGDMGKVCMPFLVTVVIQLWNWRGGALILSLVGFVGSGVVWSLARREGEFQLLPKREEEQFRERRSWGIRNPRSFSALLTIGVIDISTRSALLTFLPFLLMQKGVPANQVSFGLTLLFAGGALGKFLCGVLAERFGVIPMVVGTEILTAAGILSITMSSPSMVWVILPLVGIVLNGTSSVLYATVAEMISPEGRSRGYGLYYAVTLGFGALSPMIYGLITEVRGLSFTIVSTAFLVLLTIPLSRYLSKQALPPAGE